MTDKTIVIFRRFQGGDIIALFPFELGDSDAATCSSYMQVGQHGAADPHCVVEMTHRATAEEYEPLAHELETLGYDLVIQRRMPQSAHGARVQAMKEMQA